MVLKFTKIGSEFTFKIEQKLSFYMMHDKPK